MKLVASATATQLVHNRTGERTGRYQIDLDELRGSRRAAGELRPDETSRGTNDSGTLEWYAYRKDGLSDDSRLRRRSRGTAEVHAQVAMPVLVRTVAKAMR